LEYDTKIKSKNSKSINMWFVAYSDGGYKNKTSDVNDIYHKISS